MSKLESPRGDARRDQDAPRGDEGLDDWFERRLEARGIRPRTRRHAHVPLARILAVVALVAALSGCWWALHAGGGETEAAAPTGQKARGGGGNGNGNSAGGGGDGGGGQKAATPKPVDWRTVQVDVLNGYGGANAAADTAATLEADGWQVGDTLDAGRETTQTIVVFAPGKRRQAVAVARRLRLGDPQPIASAEGVPADATTGVAVLLGPDLLPSA